MLGQTRVSEAELSSIANSDHYNHFAHTESDLFKMVYVEDFDKVGWIGLTPLAFEASKNVSVEDPQRPNIRSWSFYTKAAHHILVSSTMQFNVPRLKLKEEHARDHRIKLVDDFGYKLARKGTFGTSGDIIYNLDTHSQIVLHEKITKPGHKEALEKYMGKHTLCKIWTTHIKPKTLFYKQQWLYGFAPGKAFPIYKLNKPDDVSHMYQFVLDIEPHLNMQKFIIEDGNGQWIDVPVDMNLFESPPSVFPDPLLFGLFADLSQAELEKREAENMNEFHILDMTSDWDGEHNRKTKDGVLTSNTTNSCFPGLVQAVFWMAENISYRHLNITCNYTIDGIPNVDSETAIVSNTIKTNQGPKFTSLPSQLFEGALGSYAFNHSTCRPGILAMQYVERIAVGNNGGSRPQDVGFSLSCSISIHAKPKDVFALHVRCLVMKTMTIANGKITITTR